MIFNDLYIKIKNSPVEFRDNICNHLEISIPTFYSRLRLKNWTNLEKEAISTYLQKEKNSLFPN